MNLLPPVGDSSEAVRDAIKRLSAARFGQSRAMIDVEIAKRLSVGSQKSNQTMPGLTSEPSNSQLTNASSADQEDNFLDGWLKKRRELKNQNEQNQLQAGTGEVAGIDQSSNTTKKHPIGEIKTKVSHFTDDVSTGAQHQITETQAVSQADNSLKINSDSDQELDLRIK